MQKSGGRSHAKRAFPRSIASRIANSADSAKYAKRMVRGPLFTVINAKPRQAAQNAAPAWPVFQYPRQYRNIRLATNASHVTR